MKILVASCDKNTETFKAFYHCMEKYWEKHPEVIYTTETEINPYYKTITHNIPLENWTKRIRMTLNDIDDEQILLMIDDCFIRKQVDIDRIEYLKTKLKGNIAVFSFEQSFDKNDLETDIIGFKKRKHGSVYEVTLLCGLWQKEKLYKVLEKDCTCWQIEENQDNYGFDYYINSGNDIIDYGGRPFKPAGIFKGKWCKEIVSFFEKENIQMDYKKKGFVEW